MALQRFATKDDDLFVQAKVAAAQQFLADELPPAVLRDPLGHHAFLAELRASKTLIPDYLARAGIDLAKSDYYQIAEQMLPSEVSPEVCSMLDDLARALRVELPMADLSS